MHFISDTTDGNELRIHVPMMIPFCIGGRWQISTIRLQWLMVLESALVPEIAMALEQTWHVECYGLGIADDAHLTGVIHNTL